MAKNGAINTAIAIQSILGEFGITNEPIDTFIEKGKNQPSDEKLDQYNALVTAFQNASGYEEKQTTASNLLRFYDDNSDDFKAKEDEIAFLRKTYQANIRLNELYAQLNQQIQNREL